MWCPSCLLPVAVDAEVGGFEESKGTVLIAHADGSADIPFGPLEAEGKVPTSKTFEPKLLSGLRVVLDESDGPNPGFGELTVARQLP